MAKRPIIYDDIETGEYELDLTVCMIARNEEATIGEAIESVKDLADEIVVVLAGESTDRTEEIAKSYGAIVGFYPAPDGRWPVDADGRELRHYGDAREATEKLAHGNYVLWIDADERLVEGHDVIRAIVEQGRLPGVRPHIVPLGTQTRQARQEMLHRRGKYRWRGAIHEWLEGMPCPIEPRIVYEEIPRLEGDRPHGEMYELLRREMGEKLDTRQLFYIAREHLNEQHWAEAIACCRLFLDAHGGWPERRSQVAVFLAQAWTACDDLYQARQAYIEAIKEYGSWAEPYYGMAVLHRDLGLFQEAIAWASASLIFAPGEEASNAEIYEWRRYDVIAYCLAAIGQHGNALPYYRRVMDAHPNDATRTNLSICERKAKEAA